MRDDVTIAEKMLEKKVWAVVGANTNSEKYGNIIFKKLKSRGYEVYAVNPNYDVVEGEKCYKDLASLPKVPDVIDMVVHPKYGLGIIEEASKVGVENVWLQPGTVSMQIINKIKENNLEYVEACVLVALR